MKFTVEPRLLDHFGIAMYNTVPKVLAELAANSFDADATRVDIRVDRKQIRIADDGVGMSRDDLENQYLRLGRDRRGTGPEGELSPGGREVIGNKGIGKLAGFGVAQMMSVRTWRDGLETTVVLDRAALDEADDLESFEFQPEFRDVDPGTSGTEVILFGLLDDLPQVDEAKLRAYLARHLPTRPGWTVAVNGEECSLEDIPGERFDFDEEIAGFGRVKGFYIIASDKRGLSPGFAIRVRGRIVQEPSLFDLTQQSHGYFNLVRIVGELNPDFLDPVQGERTRRDAFVINTSRSGFNPDDPGVLALREYANRKLRDIAEGLARERTRERKEKALRRNPALEARLHALGPEMYKKLDDALDAIIGKLSKNEEDATVDEVVDIIIRYYESDTLRVILDSIREAGSEEVERLSDLLSRYGAARIGEVAEMLHSQLEIVEVLRGKVADGVLEAEIHDIIANNIWLIDEPLNFWFSNRQFATQLTDGLAEKFTWAKAKRPDLVCLDDRTLHGQGAAYERLVVIEFKRPGVTVGTGELTQVMLYKNVFKASLAGINDDQIEVIILGDTFDPAFDRGALGVGYTILSYEELLTKALDRYRDLYSRLAPDGLPRAIGASDAQ